MNSQVESSIKTGTTNSVGWRRIFACDARSLAAMRIALGLLILIDLAMRLTSLEAMYTDAGFFSVADRTEHVTRLAETTDPLSWSLHALSGSMTWQIILFAIAALAATMMIVGWKTRVACIVSWILLTSLQMRNPLILHSGDCLFRLAMFWAMFLPLGAMWSVDRSSSMDRDEAAPPVTNPVVTGATCGLIMTLCSLYFFAGIAKLNPVWYSGEAMDYVLKLNIYTTSAGSFLLGFPWLLKLLSWATLVGEIVLPMLILVPWKNERWRYLSIVFFAGLHLSIAACMSIGLFSWVALAVWLALLPSSFWAKLGIGIPTKDVQSNASQVPVSSWALLANGVCLALAAYFMLWNVATIDHPVLQKAMPMEARVVGKWLNLRQTFRMFDVPPKHSPWFVYEARLKNGESVDIFRNQPVDHARPDSILATIPRHHWRRLHRNLARPQFSMHRKPVSEYLVRKWNKTHDADSQIEVAKTTAYLEEITADGSSPGLVTQVWSIYGEEFARQQTFDDALKKMKEKGIILP